MYWTFPSTEKPLRSLAWTDLRDIMFKKVKTLHQQLRRKGNKYFINDYFQITIGKNASDFLRDNRKLEDQFHDQVRRQITEFFNHTIKRRIVNDNPVINDMSITVYSNRYEIGLFITYELNTELIIPDDATSLSFRPDRAQDRIDRTLDIKHRWDIGTGKEEKFYTDEDTHYGKFADVIKIDTNVSLASEVVDSYLDDVIEIIRSSLLGLIELSSRTGTRDEVLWERNQLQSAARNGKLPDLETVKKITSQLKETQQELQRIGYRVPFNELPPDIQVFTLQRFKSYIDTHPKLEAYLKEFQVEFRPRPKTYSSVIMSEYLPSKNICLWYGTPEELFSKKSALVHELVHSIQVFAKGRFDGIALPPNSKTSSYRNLTEDYLGSPGEVQAYIIQSEFESFIRRATDLSISDENVINNRRIFRDRFFVYRDNGPRIFWSSQIAQDVRFEQLIKIGDLDNKSILDVGTGYADFYDFLKLNDIIPSRFVGSDIVPEIIDIARKKHPSLTLEVRDILEDSYAESSFDFVFGSGIFAFPSNSYTEYVISMLHTMLKTAKIGVAVNFLKQKDNQDTGLQVNTVEGISKLIKDNITESFKVLDGYLPDDFTVFLYK